MEIWPFIAAGAVALLAIGASMHAILTKRDVGTTIAWVGLIWLSPIIGAVLYLLLGINRIRRRASQVRASAAQYRKAEALPQHTADDLADALRPEHRHLEAVARLGDRVTGRPLLNGNHIEPLPGGDQAYPAMLAAVDEARRSVTLLSYIFDDDLAGRRFLKALRSAHDRGVEVRVLIDDMGARYSFPPMVKSLRRTGVRVARFLPTMVPWRTPFFNLRNHRKILIVDGLIGFTGGMNIRGRLLACAGGGSPYSGPPFPSGRTCGHRTSGGLRRGLDVHHA